MTALLGGFYLLLHHEFAQCPVDPGLVAGSFFLEPGQHIGVEPERNRSLERLVHLRDVRCYVARSFTLFSGGLQSGDILPGNLAPGNFPAFRDSRLSFHLPGICISLYVHISKYKMFHVEH